MESPVETVKKPVVYVSNYPLHYFASRIGGDHIVIRFPGAALTDPSVWTPPADTVVAMQQADLILLNGAGFEGWLMNVSLPDSLLVDTSASFASKLLPGGETFTHSHGEEGEHTHSATAFTTWMDLSLASLQAKAIRDALSRKQPIWEDVFEANYQALASDLRELDNAFKERVSSGPEPLLAYSHPVYQYFQKAYGLEGPSMHWEPDEPLDHEMLHEIGHLKKEEGIQYLIWEQAPLPESIGKLEKEGISSLVIQVMGGSPETGDFLSGFRQNLHTLRQTLNEASE